MNKPLLIRFWHGRSKGSFLHTKVEKLCRKSELDGNLFFDGTLTEWANAWRDKFLYIPTNESEFQFIEGTVWITPHNNFGQM